MGETMIVRESREGLPKRDVIYHVAKEEIKAFERWFKVSHWYQAGTSSQWLEKMAEDSQWLEKDLLGAYKEKSVRDELAIFIPGYRAGQKDKSKC
jgi:hypothetical protein